MLLEDKDCTGQLCWQKNILDIEFDISCANDGTIKLKLKDIPFTKDVLWLHELFHEKGRYFGLLQFKGNDSKGNSITSNSVILNSLRSRLNETESYISPEGTCMHLHIDNPDTIDYDKAGLVSVQYHLLGFECFDRLVGKTDLGSIEVVGSTKIKNYDEVTGVLTIEVQPDQDFDLTPWLASCDSSARSILDILSLSNDKYIAWTCRNLYFNESWMSSFFIGPRRSGKPSRPLFTYLNLQPILNLAITNYSEDMKHETGLNIAVEWYLMKSTYSELQFLNTMTALEHLVYVYTKREKKERIFPNNTFEKVIGPKVREALDKALDTLLNSEKYFVKRETYPDKVKAAKEKITEINRYPFKENLWKFLGKHKVLLDDIEQDIEPAISARHKIVHRGLYHQDSGDQSIRDHLAVLEELLKRIFLSLLKYEGEYQSFLNGPEWKKFSPLS
jgi:hypothetical protein